MRPTLARISSAASGFFFCGMIEEPVENRSDSETKRNWAEDQITNSSANRDRCIAQIDAHDATLRGALRDRAEALSRDLSDGNLGPTACRVRLQCAPRF